jgi:4-hydroxybenzoate polyprenyltransferase
MAAYAGIAVLAGLTLNGPTRFEFLLRALVWLLLGAMALKTVLHHLRDRMHDREQ